MQVTRTGQLAGLLLTSALALTACGSGDNTKTTAPTTATKPAATGGAAGTACATGSLSAQGSTFQANA